MVTSTIAQRGAPPLASLLRNAAKRLLHWRNTSGGVCKWLVTSKNEKSDCAETVMNEALVYSAPGGIDDRLAVIAAIGGAAHCFLGRKLHKGAMPTTEWRYHRMAARATDPVAIPNRLPQ